MWLINTRTLALEFFQDTSKTPYAILSHTWEGGEVSHQEFRDPDIASLKDGYLKIVKVCELALLREPPLEYCWVDTCCIDKSSSAELSESINSMYRWYNEAQVCFAFLSDLQPMLQADEFPAALSQCRWFTRGWTLQELIAPEHVYFFDQAWNLCGTKKQLVRILSSITSIPKVVLERQDMLSEMCVAARMSWAAARRTTRPEDGAYCLLGIFNVYMTMIYGEGDNAFIRLQEEIIKNSSDMSIFGWTSSTITEKISGVFAQSPADFASCTNYVLPRGVRTEFTLTNKGVRFDADLYTLTSTLSAPSFGFELNCINIVDNTSIKVGIYLLMSAEYEYVRLNPDTYVDTREWWRSGGETRKVRLESGRFCVAKSLDKRSTSSVLNQYRAAILIRGVNDHLILAAGPSDYWDASKQLFLTLWREDTTHYVHFNMWDFPPYGIECFLVCGLENYQNPRPFCHLWTERSYEWTKVKDFLRHRERGDGFLGSFPKDDTSRSGELEGGRQIIAAITETDESVYGEPRQVKFRVDVRTCPIGSE